MIEQELTYLVKYLPSNLSSSPAKEIIDIYVPIHSDHPKLRVRKNGDIYEITKKQPLHAGDASAQEEQTISLNADEFAVLCQVPAQKVRKIRYFVECEGHNAEIDVFQDELTGLIVADFEFENKEEKNGFIMPDFCLADITQERFIAGGVICGKTYSDIEIYLEKYSYKKLVVS